MANWWDPIPIGTKLMVNGQKAVRTKDGVTMVNSVEYGQQVQHSPSDQKALEQMTQEAAQARLLATRANEFMSRQTGAYGGQGVATGPQYQDMDLIPGMHAIPNIMKGVTNAWDNVTHNGETPIQDLDNINSATWAQLRPAGSGPIRNYEAQGWKSAFPNSANYGPANQQIQHRLNTEADSLEARNAFVQQQMQQGVPLAQASLNWQKQQGNQQLQARSAAARSGAPQAPRPAAPAAPRPPAPAQPQGGSWTDQQLRQMFGGQ